MGGPILVLGIVIGIGMRSCVQSIGGQRYTGLCDSGLLICLVAICSGVGASLFGVVVSIVGNQDHWYSTYKEVFKSQALKQAQTTYFHMNYCIELCIIYASIKDWAVAIFNQGYFP